MPLLERLPVGENIRQWAVWSTTARLVVTEPAAADEAERLVAGLLDRVDAAASRFRADSELSRLPAGGGPVSPLLAELVGAALRVAEETDGDVDPTLADDLVALGYDRDFAELSSSRAGSVPTTVVRRVRHDWRDIRLIDGILRMPPGARLDLGAAAKAHTADRAARLVHAELGCGALVSLGGDLATAGPAPGPERTWPVLVQDGDAEPACVIGLSGGGLATSSTIARRWRRGDGTVHHVLDPVTGRSADPVWRTVSVAAGSCLRANALTTAAIVRGVRAEHWLRGLGVPARLVRRDGGIVRLGGWP